MIYYNAMQIVLIFLLDMLRVRLLCILFSSRVHIYIFALLEAFTRGFLRCVSVRRERGVWRRFTTKQIWFEFSDRFPMHVCVPLWRRRRRRHTAMLFIWHEDLCTFYGGLILRFWRLLCTRATPEKSRAFSSRTKSFHYNFRSRFL